MAGGRDQKETATAKTTDTNTAQDNPTAASPSPEGSRPGGSYKWLAWIFKGWFLLLAHTICSIAIALSVALAINGYNAIDTLTPRYFDGKLHLRVSDVTTLVSAGLVVNKFFTTAWVAVAILDCTVILKQNTVSRLTRSQFLFLEKYRLPPWARYPFGLPRGTWSWSILFILLCILPQQFTAPLISGAVNWNPVSVPGSGSISVNSSQDTASAVLFEQYPSYAQYSVALRHQIIARAQGLASLAWSDSSTVLGNGTSSTGNGCRHVVNNDGLTTNSTLLDSIIPCIKIQNIEWATTANQIPISVANDAFSYASSALSEVNTTLDLISTPGQIMLFNPNMLWNSSTTNPVPTIASGPQTLVVSIYSQSKLGNCANVPSSVFGDAKSISQYLYLWFYACYGFANITITAGVTRSRVSTYLSPIVVEDQTPIDQVTLEPNKWVQEALWLLPDLMNQLAFANVSQTPTWENLDGYAESMIRQAYLGAWDALHQTFDDANSVNSTISTAIPAVSRIQASVSNARVFSWLAVSLLILIGGIVLTSMPFIVPEGGREVCGRDHERGKRRCTENFK